MNLQLTQEQEMIVGMVRRFVKEEIQPREINLDPDADELPEADKALLVAKVKEMGLYGLDIPSEYGGPDLDMVTRTLIAIELSQHRAGLYTPCYGVFGGAGLAQLYEATDEQKDNYLYPTLRGEKSGFFGLTEHSGGSDPARAIQKFSFPELIKPIMGWCLRELHRIAVGEALPVLLSIQTRPAFM